MKPKHAIRITEMKLRRWEAARYYGINIQTRSWCYINTEKNTCFEGYLPDPMLTEAVIAKLRRDTKKYEVIKWNGNKVLINKFYVVKAPRRTRNIFSKYRGKPTVVLKCDSKKKKARAKSAARRAWWEKHFSVREDVYAFNSISNTSFGHPLRIKAFNLQDKTRRRNELAHKEKNTPSLSDDGDGLADHSLS